MFGVLQSTIYIYLCFNGPFPGEHALDTLGFLASLFRMRTFGDKRHSFNWPDVFCGYTNNDVKALKETHTHTHTDTHTKTPIPINGLVSSFLHSPPDF